MKKLITVIFLLSSVVWGQTFDNGNFESWTGDNPDGWTLTPDNSDISFTKSDLNDGRGNTGYALKIIANNNGSSYDGTMEAIVTNIVAGTDYGELIIYTKSLNGDNNIWIRVWDTRWYDDSDTQVGSDFDNNSYSSGDNTDWLAYSTTIGVAPTGATKLRVHFRVYVQSGFSTGDHIWVDDLTLNGKVLPVELTTFSASVVNNNVELNWQTATEVNNYGFEVERKILKQVQNDNWERIGFVNGHGNSNTPKEYSFIDKTAENSGKYFYRLKQVDVDGQFEYSPEIEVTIGAPAKFELSQNYPNPFNPTTNIRFTLPEAGNVKLAVYNLLGQKVADLVNQNMEAGFHNITFNGSKLTSGIYIYRLEAGNNVMIRKMQLVK